MKSDRDFDSSSCLLSFSLVFIMYHSSTFLTDTVCSSGILDIGGIGLM